MAQDLRLEIMRLLLNSDDDVSVREIARRLDRPLGHVFYHLKRLNELGICTRTEVDGLVYYAPQDLFTEEIEETLETLIDLSRLIKDADGEKVANCITMFLKCYDSIDIV